MLFSEKAERVARRIRGKRMFEWREVREDERNRWDGNRGAGDVGMTGR